MSNLDKIEEFEQLTFKQWIAFATAAGGLDVVKGVMRGTMKLVVEIVRRLTTLTAFDVAAGECKVQEFFLNRDGLRISDNFRNFILASANHGVPYVSGATIAYSDLAEAANNDEIRAELPKGHVFTDVNVFLVFLATLIEAQWLNETEGVLISMGYANIFYVEIAGTVFAVHVSWRAVGGRWLCYAGRPHAGRWAAGHRAFSATAA